jgi:hypothetical protein
MDIILMSQTIDQVRSEIIAQAKQVFEQSSKQIITLQINSGLINGCQEF